MMAGSDLDLMLIYDHPTAVTESRVAESSGARSLPTAQYFVRLAQAYIAALTAPGIDGPLYAADMRLRPSGNQGPVAVSLASFRQYHARSAWTWERMALTRARVVAGPPALRKRVETAIAESLHHPGEAAQVLSDARAMRARLTRDLPPTGKWDVKLRPGGQIDVEFVAQALQLVHAGRNLFDPTTRNALKKLAEAGVLPPEDAALLIRADRIWRTVQGILRITQGRSPPDNLPDASARPLLRAAAEAGALAPMIDNGAAAPMIDNGAAAPTVDTAALLATLERLAREVRAVFVKHIGDTPP
jgi:glutamate-ammonia-ligase adenylyltransferase